MTPEKARELAQRFGVRMCDEHGDTHDEELYCLGLDDIIDMIDMTKALANHIPDAKKMVAQPEKEPVAITTGVYGGRFTYVTNKPHVILPDGMGLYASPQRTWVGLTDEEVIDLWPDLIMHRHTYQFWRNLEAKLKEKNT